MQSDYGDQAHNACKRGTDKTEAGMNAQGGRLSRSQGVEREC
jgi:hypothetical protein